MENPTNREDLGNDIPIDRARAEKEILEALKSLKERGDIISYEMLPYVEGEDPDVVKYNFTFQYHPVALKFEYNVDGKNGTIEEVKP